MAGGSKSSPHSCAARPSLSNAASSPSWSARANGGGMRPAPSIIPRSTSRIWARPSSTIKQLSTSAFSEKRSTSSAALVCGSAVLIEALPRLDAQLAARHVRPHPLVHVEAIAEALLEVLDHVQHAVQPQQISQDKRPHRSRL